MQLNPQGKTAVVSTDAQLWAALRDQSVTRIEVTQDIDMGSEQWAQKVDVNRSVVVEGIPDNAWPVLNRCANKVLARVH